MIVRSRAPLRLGLAGGGTDVSPYPEKYTGYVLNTTISLFAYCTIEENDTGKISINSLDLKEHLEFDKGMGLFPIDNKLDIIKQCLNYFINNGYVSSYDSFSISTFCDVPPGTGLGSSSTLVVSIVNCINKWLNLNFDEYEIAKISYDIERVIMKISGGKQDQYAAVFGGFNFIEFHDLGKTIVNPIRLKKWVLNELQASILIFNLGTSRSSDKIIREQKKSIKENEKSLTSMHKIKEHAFLMKNAILTGELCKVPEILNDSWLNKKSLSKSISNSNIDRFYDEALKAGALAGKISGAGGGGVMMLYINPVKKLSIIRHLEKLGCQHIPFVFEKFGCSSWKSIQKK